jgi:bile acid:Na+ symporter, BASS family
LQQSVLTTVMLPAALALIMFGLGLALAPQDFARIATRPKAVVIALVAQLLVLPAVCFGLVVLFGLEPLLAAGMMLLAASPGGTTANLYSHLFGGNVALNVTLTAVNSVLAIFTLPLVVNFALNHFLSGTDQIGLQFGKSLQVFAIVLIPVAIGMFIRNRSVDFADRMQRPVRILSVVVLVLVIIGTLVSEADNIATYFADAGLVALLFNVISLGVGYFLPRLAGLDRGDSVAAAMEIGIHNGTLAIAIAVSVLQRVELAVPAAVYSLVMFPLAALFGWGLTRLHARAPKAHAGRIP